MKSLVSAINTLVLSINNLTAALNKKNGYTYTQNSTTTSNPYSSNVKITSYAQEIQEGTVRISKAEHQALTAIYNALTDKGSHPKHHDHVARELNTKWPVLSRALDSLVESRKYKKTWKDHK